MGVETGCWFENQKEIDNKIQNISTDGTTFTGDVTGDITGDVIATVLAAEHGAGAISTAFAPKTTRRTENGTIIKEIKFSMLNLKSAQVTNDIIGLAAGVSYIGRYVVATDGIIYKTELICLELPTVGDDDVNVVELASDALIFEGNGGTDYVVNGDVAAKGQVIENLTPALTANEYWYLTAGAGDTAGTYGAGMFILRTYGHAALA